MVKLMQNLIGVGVYLGLVALLYGTEKIDPDKEADADPSEAYYTMETPVNPSRMGPSRLRHSAGLPWEFTAQKWSRTPTTAKEMAQVTKEGGLTYHKGKRPLKPATFTAGGDG